MYSVFFLTIKKLYASLITPGDPHKLMSSHGETAAALRRNKNQKWLQYANLLAISQTNLSIMVSKEEH